MLKKLAVMIEDSLSAGVQVQLRWSCAGGWHWLLDELPQRRSPGKMKTPTRVMLVTGHGESRVHWHGSVVKKRVLEVVNELGTVVEQSNRGCVVLSWPLTGVGHTVLERVSFLKLQYC